MADDSDFEEPETGIGQDDGGSDFSLSSEEEEEDAFEDESDGEFEEEAPAKKKKKAPAKKAAASKSKSSAAPKAKAEPKKKAAAATKKKAAPKERSKSASPKPKAVDPATLDDGGLASAAAGKLDKGSIKEKDAGPLLQQYMEEQNRPYSAINVHDNLHGAVKKVQVTRTLDKLTEQGSLRSKQWGKFKVYWPDQGRFGEISEESLKEAERRLEAARQDAAAAKEARKNAEGSAAALGAEPTDAELEQLLQAREQEVQALRARVQKLRALAEAEGWGSGGAEAGAKENGAEAAGKSGKAAAGAGSKPNGAAAKRSGAGADSREGLEARMEEYVKVWRTRKRKCDEVTGMLAEGLGLKRRKVEENVGIETDQDVGLPEPKAFLSMPVDVPMGGAGAETGATASSTAPGAVAS